MFEGRTLDLPTPILVEVTEHHGELLEGILGHSALVSGLDLLLQVVTDPHAKLVELIPLLGQANSRVLRVPVVQDQLLLQDRSKVLDLAKVGGTSSYLVSLDENNLINFVTLTSLFCGNCGLVC